MNRKFISNSNYVLRKVLNSKENLDIIKDFIESFLDIEIQEINLNPYLKNKEKYLPSEEKFGIVDVRIKLNSEEEKDIMQVSTNARRKKVKSSWHYKG